MFVIHVFTLMLATTVVTDRCQLYRGLYPIVKVLDGDTVAFDVSSFMPAPLNTTLNLRVRVVDCPESGHRAMCGLEADLAAAATAYTTSWVRAHASTDIGILLCTWDKYGGRVLGDVVSWSAGLFVPAYLSSGLLTTGHAVAYSGRGERHDWCVPGSCSADAANQQPCMAP